MATELLAGIPSVVYGFFGLVVLVPWVREIGRTLHQGGQRKQYDHSIHSSGNDDLTNDHRTYGICA